MIVIVGNTKGGVGKMTLATQIALARQTSDRAVLLIDADRLRMPPRCGLRADGCRR